MTLSGPAFLRIERDFLLVQGVDAEKYLHSQLSQDVEGLAVQSSRYSLVLQPTGKLDGVVRITRFEDTVFLLDMEPGCAEAVAARLNRFKIRVQATIEEVPWQCVAVRGPGARALAESLQWAPSEGLVVAAWWGQDDAVDLVGATVSDLDTQVPVARLTASEYEAARAAAAWPLVGIDIEPGCVPGETGLLGIAVSFSKGCYPGQELVERMNSRAAVAPRQLRRLEVAEGTRIGDPVLRDGAEVGVVTSVFGTCAIARLGRDAFEMGGELQPEF